MAKQKKFTLRKYSPKCTIYFYQSVFNRDNMPVCPLIKSHIEYLFIAIYFVTTFFVDYRHDHDHQHDRDHDYDNDEIIT